MKKISAIFISIFLLSCNNENTDIAETRSDDLRVNGVSTTAFTATISGVFDNISKIDIALGKNGILYCPKTDKAESIFKSWLEGNDNPDCHVYNTKDGFDNELFSAIIGPLYPETEYAFCLFSQGKDGSNRKISSVSTFTTGHFSPEFEELQIEDIHYIDATVKSSLKMDAKDAENCTRGLLLTEKPGGGINEALNITEITSLYNDDDPRFNVIVHGIKPDMNYYARLFVKYKGSDGNDTFLYGPEKTFSAKRSEEMAVDLGLPSGIMWANCDLGEWIFNADYHPDDLYYRWGSIKSVDRYDNTGKNGYEWWNSSDNCYVQIGTDISGSKYDVAHNLLGGKWRLPSKKDVEELINYCNTKQILDLSAIVWITEWEKYENVIRYAGNIIGPNNNRIMLQEDSWWTGAISDDGVNACVFTYYAKKQQSSTVQVNRGEIVLRDVPREEPNKIRAVWDPNM